MAVVAVDFRVDGFDLLLDPVGWAVLAVSVGRLADLDGWFTAAASVSWVGALVALPVVTTAEAGASAWVGDLTLLLQSMALFSMCTGMIRHLPADHPGRRWLDPVRWVDLAATVIVYGGGLVGGAAEAGLALPALVAIVVVFVAFVVITWTLREEPPLAGTGLAAPA